MLAGCTVTPSRPKWSIAMDATTCPARNRPTVVAVPRRGVRTMEAHTKKAPNNPPSHIHQGALMMGPSSGTERRKTAVVAKRITVPTRNESAAASTGPPTTWRSWLLMANCVGAAIPAASATGSNSSQVMFLTPLSVARRRRRGSAPGHPPRPRSGTGCSGRAGGRRGPSSCGFRGRGSPLRGRPARPHRGPRPPRRCPARSATACARAHRPRMIGVLSPSLLAFLVLAKLEHDVRQLGDEELLHGEPHGVPGTRQARHELGAHGPGDRPTHDRGGPDLLVGEHPENLTETVELLLDHTLDDLVGGVASRDAGTARRDHGVHLGVGEEVDEVRPDTRDFVSDDPAGHDLLPGLTQYLFCGISSGVGLAGPRVTDGEYGDPDGLGGRFPVPLDALAQNIPPCKNGLVARSLPISVCGPCPG